MSALYNLTHSRGKLPDSRHREHPALALLVGEVHHRGSQPLLHRAPPHFQILARFAHGHHLLAHGDSLHDAAKLLHVFLQRPDFRQKRLHICSFFLIHNLTLDGSYNSGTCFRPFSSFPQKHTWLRNQ